MVLFMEINKVSIPSCWAPKYFLFGVLAGAMRSIFRLMTVMLWAVGGALLARYLFDIYGNIGYTVGLLSGILLSFYATWILTFLTMVLFFPMPACRTGQSRTLREYSWHPFNIFGYVGRRTFVYHCACGDKYIRTGRKRVSIEIDGVVRPYKKLEGWNVWLNES